MINKDMKQKTLFDEENRLEQLSQLGDPLNIEQSNQVGKDPQRTEPMVS